MNTLVKFEVNPTSITGHSLLVLPHPNYHTPRLSLQMETGQAKRLAHAANVLPELVEAASKVLQRIESSGVEWECADDLRAELARAENVETQP